MKEFYTKLTYERKGSNDYGPTIISQEEAAQDLPLDDMFRMFHTLMIGATFYDNQFERVCAEYLEERGYTVKYDADE